GYPGFTLLGPPSNGSASYSPARQVGTPMVVTLPPGSMAHATFTFLRGPDVCNQGIPWIPTEVLTIPPDETSPLRVAWTNGSVDNCQGGATHPGPTSDPFKAARRRSPTAPYVPLASG